MFIKSISIYVWCTSATAAIENVNLPGVHRDESSCTTHRPQIIVKMVVFDSIFFSHSHRLLTRLLFGGKFRKRLLFKKLWKKRVYARAAAAFLDEVPCLNLNDVCRARTRPAYEYEGDLLQNLDGTSPQKSRHWAALPPHEYELTSSWRQRMFSINFWRCWSPTF